MLSRLFVILLLIGLPQLETTVFSQEIYNNCNDAMELCPGEKVNANNIGANSTSCPACEDDFTFCFTANNTIWFKFTTNGTGGDIQVDFTNMTFELGANQDKELQATIIEASIPCSASSYTAIGNCVSDANTNFSLNATGLTANSTYYIVVNGDDVGVSISVAAECTFDIEISGTGVDRSGAAITATASKLNLCENELVTFTTDLSNCPDSSLYEWYINSNLVANTIEPYFTTTLLNDQDTIVVKNSCFSTCSKIVSSVPIIVTVKSIFVDAGSDVIIYPGGSAQLNGVTTGANAIWSPDIGLHPAEDINTIAAPDVTTVYTLLVTDEGCTETDAVTVFVDHGVIVPTNFSPNGDGANDFFELKGIENFPDCVVKIYDRWGQVVYQGVGYNKNKSWNGTFKGKPCLAGTFFYYIELNDVAKTIKKGSITLIR